MKDTQTMPLSVAESIELFAGVAPEDLTRLFQAAHRKSFQAGEFVFMQGDPADRMYILLQGRIKLSQIGPGGQQAIIKIIKPVTLFALVAMTRLRNYLVTAQAAQKCTTIYWTRQELMDFVSAVPEIALNALRIIAVQLQELQERFRLVTTERVESRLASMLIQLASQVGKRVEKGILIDLVISREDLAQMTGTTLYTASRVLSQWEQQGFVIAERERVTIVNPHGLARIIEGD